jgi:hypothetical protein
LLLKNLNASVEASGPHDFAVRFCAIRQRRINVYRIPPRVRDDRDTPLQWDETAKLIQLIWVSRKALFRKFRNNFEGTDGQFPGFYRPLARRRVPEAVPKFAKPPHRVAQCDQALPMQLRDLLLRLALADLA